MYTWNGKKRGMKVLLDGNWTAAHAALLTHAFRRETQAVCLPVKRSGDGAVCMYTGREPAPCTTLYGDLMKSSVCVRSIRDAVGVSVELRGHSWKRTASVLI